MGLQYMQPVRPEYRYSFPKAVELTDTYEIDVCAPQDALCALMLVLAIDAEKCSRND